MKRVLSFIFCITVSFAVSAQMNQNLRQFWNSVGQGYGNNNMDSLVDFHGCNFEKIMLDNPYPNVDERDRVWKLVYPGGEFYFYELYRTGNSFLVYWIITSDFILPERYESLFSMSINEIRELFGKEYRWQDDDTAAHGVPSGDLYFHYDDKKILEEVYWVEEFP